MESHRTLLPFLVTDEINLALVWATVAGTAYKKGEIPTASQAKAKAEASYSNAMKILSHVPIDSSFEPLLAELEALAVALDELAVIAARLTGKST